MRDTGLLNGKSFLFERWPRFAYNHAGRVLLASLAILIGLGVLFAVGAGEYGNKFTIPSAESQQLFDLLEQRFPARAGDSATSRTARSRR